MYSKIQQRKKQKEVIYIVWLQTYQHLTRCKTGLIMHPIMAQTKKERVWVSNPLKTCLRHKIPMTLVEFFHRYWLSLSGEWSSVNIKYGLLWSSTPWYGGLWQGDQKPPKPNLSPIFYQLFSYGSCRTMYLRWIYINKKRAAFANLIVCSWQKAVAQWQSFFYNKGKIRAGEVGAPPHNYLGRVGTSWSLVIVSSAATLWAEERTQCW